ncbi:MAG: hypothetical protein RL580_97 [Pseudomonadota bacterium]
MVGVDPSQRTSAVEWLKVQTNTAVSSAARRAADQDDAGEDWEERVTEHVFTLLTPEDYF